MKSTSLIFLTLFAFCIAANNSNSQSKYERLSKMKSGGVVTMNDDKYTEYMLNGDRDFDAILLYTTLGSRYRCVLCPAANSEFGLVASAYESQEEKASNNVLFIRVPIDLAPGVFQFHEFTTAPIITFLAATDRITKRLNANNDYQLDYPVLAEGIASYVRSKIHTTIEIKRFPWPQVIIACLFVFGLPLIAFIYLFQYERVYAFFGKKRIYLVISLLVYGMAVTGFAYDLIHGPALLNCGPNGCSLFAKGPNQQTMAEGLVTGGLLIACAVILIMLIERTKNEKVRMTERTPFTFT
ncbi:uncharacterized protein [Blastocystis hominis]|uniref:Uncharacterized protein n=1 Tax=Blastocystis hominis TaxID=12968 RepID=D8LUU8_BLAHO|nr:uncharacterized protein [Blastocystis hominis]CBK19587.2 unnamed protein product [Blastocystis hominis]|eukprot:XP_012893635.1 uncharacterized protein [Blastocystis hominis]